MTKLKDFFSTNKYAIFWTIGYAIFMWAVLKGMFNFNIFSAAQWSRLFHAQLYGFGGFVFAILILAALPLYIATTTIIIRTKSPLFTIKIPTQISQLFSAPPKIEDEQPEPAQSPQDTPPAPEPGNDAAKEENDVLSAQIPAELRANFIRARNNMAHRPSVAQDVAPAAPAQSDSEEYQFPLPTDFDVDIPAPDEAAPIFAPTFTEINFDTPHDEKAAPTSKNAIEQYLESAGIEFSTQDDIILTKDMAVALHTDPDFWIADDETWFATGKSRPSPVGAVIAIAASNNLRPVLYLEQQNIMDLDARRAEWAAQGVHVITDPADLPK